MFTKNCFLRALLISAAAAALAAAAQAATNVQTWDLSNVPFITDGTYTPGEEGMPPQGSYAGTGSYSHDFAKFDASVGTLNSVAIRYYYTASDFTCSLSADEKEGGSWVEFQTVFRSLAFSNSCSSDSYSNSASQFYTGFDGLQTPGTFDFGALSDDHSAVASNAADYLGTGVFSLSLSSAFNFNWDDWLMYTSIYDGCTTGTLGDGSRVEVTYSYTPAPIPEPSTLVLLAAGLFGLLCYAWRKRK
jgi:hypothetical protein